MHFSAVQLCIFGYAFHLVVVSLLGWNGTLLFLPVSVDTESVLWRFNLTQLVSFPATFFLGAVASQRWGVEKYAKPLALSSFTATLLGVALLFPGFAKAGATSLSLCSAIAGVFVGMGNSAFFLSWQNVFASQDKTFAGMEIMVGSGAAGAVYLIVIQLKPTWLPLAVLVFLLVVMTVCLMKAISATSAHSQEALLSGVDKDVRGRLIRKLWRPALCIASLAFARGIAPALVLNNVTFGPLLSTFMTLGRIASAVIFYFILRRLTSSVSSWMDRFYSIAVVCVATGFVLLPVLGQEYQFVFALAVYTIFSVASIFMMFLCVSISQEYGVRPLTVYGVFAGFVYMFSKAGFGAIYYAHVQIDFELVQLLTVALFSIYLLFLAYFVSRRKRAKSSNEISNSEDRDSEILMNSQEDAGEDTQSVSAGDTLAEGDENIAMVSVKDVLREQCGLISSSFGLSAREAEIVEFLALGRSVPYIAESLFISENTVRTHCKNIYRKMGIHSKRELVDLVEKSGSASDGANK